MCPPIVSDSNLGRRLILMSLSKNESLPLSDGSPSLLVRGPEKKFRDVIASARSPVITITVRRFILTWAAVLVEDLEI